MRLHPLDKVQRVYRLCKNVKFVGAIRKILERWSRIFAARKNRNLAVWKKRKNHRRGLAPILFRAVVESRKKEVWSKLLRNRNRRIVIVSRFYVVTIMIRDRAHRIGDDSFIIQNQQARYIDFDHQETL